MSDQALLLYFAELWLSQRSEHSQSLKETTRLTNSLGIRGKESADDQDDNDEKNVNVEDGQGFWVPRGVLDCPSSIETLRSLQLKAVHPTDLSGDAVDEHHQEDMWIDCRAWLTTEPSLTQWKETITVESLEGWKAFIGELMVKTWERGSQPSRAAGAGPSFDNLNAALTSASKATLETVLLVFNVCVGGGGSGALEVTAQVQAQPFETILTAIGIASYTHPKTHARTFVFLPFPDILPFRSYLERCRSAHQKSDGTVRNSFALDLIRQSKGPGNVVDDASALAAVNGLLQSYAGHIGAHPFVLGLKAFLRAQLNSPVLWSWTVPLRIILVVGSNEFTESAFALMHALGAALVCDDEAMGDGDLSLTWTTGNAVSDVNVRRWLTRFPPDADFMSRPGGVTTATSSQRDPDLVGGTGGAGGGMCGCCMALF